MKYLSIAVLVCTVLITSCIKKYDGTQSTDGSGFTGSKSEVEDYFEPKVLTALENLGYKFNVGGTPPDITGSFLGDKVVLKVSDVPSDIVGHQFTNYTYNFNNQSGENIDFSSTFSGGADYGTGCFISGSGNDFSIYVITEGTSNGQQTKTAKALSGTLTSSGISNFMIALIMLDNYGNGTLAGGTLLEIGQGRLIHEADGLMDKQ